MIRRRSTATEQRRQTPRLVLRFTLFTAASLAVASAAIFFMVRGFVTSQARDAVEQNTRFVAEAVLARRLTPADFTAPPSANRRRRLDQIFRTQVMIDDVQRATLYGLNGRVSYSSDPELVGKSTAESTTAYAALRGKQIRTTVGADDLAPGGSAKVLTQYVPIWFGGRPVGTLVTTRDYGPIARSVRATFVPIALVLEGLLVVLFAALFPVLRRVTRQLDSHLDEFEHQALHDSLTGLPNRVLFHDRIQLALASARRRAGRAAVLLLDLDRFKEINDVLGHASGDELLRSLGERLSHAVRETDTIARLGGDEFGLVMLVESEQDIVEAAARIHRALERPFEIGGLSLEVGASIGGVLFPDHALDVDTLVRFADVAMYAAKRKGTELELYDPSEDDGSRESLTLGSELRRALDDGAIVAHYQPKVEVASGRIVGAEALVRWAHPERGLVLPGEFLPLVAKAGLMSTLTSRVLDLAVQRAAEWERQGLGIGVAVNVDVAALHDPEFPRHVQETLERTGLPPERLTLEITETSIMADPDRAGRVAQELSEIGVRLSIDDFGTGYSSLGHLTALPLAELKIDRSFVHRMTESATDRTIVRTILDLGSSLDLSVVAEGIESQDTRAMLQRLGCRVAQGFAFGSPVPAEELTAHLARRGVVAASASS